MKQVAGKVTSVSLEGVGSERLNRPEFTRERCCPTFRLPSSFRRLQPSEQPARPHGRVVGNEVGRDQLRWSALAFSAIAVADHLQHSGGVKGLAVVVDGSCDTRLSSAGD